MVAMKTFALTLMLPSVNCSKVAQYSLISFMTAVLAQYISHFGFLKHSMLQ